MVNFFLDLLSPDLDKESTMTYTAVWTPLQLLVIFITNRESGPHKLETHILSFLKVFMVAATFKRTVVNPVKYFGPTNN